MLFLNKILPTLVSSIFILVIVECQDGKVTNLGTFKLDLDDNQQAAQGRSAQPAAAAMFRSSSKSQTAGECKVSLGRSAAGGAQQPQTAAFQAMMRSGLGRSAGAPAQILRQPHGEFFNKCQKKQSKDCQRNFRHLECFNLEPHGNLYVVNIPGIYEQKIRINTCRLLQNWAKEEWSLQKEFCKNKVLLFKPPNNYFECELELPFCSCTDSPRSKYCEHSSQTTPACSFCGSRPIRIRN